MHSLLTVNLGIPLLIASVVAIGTRRLNFPYSVGLVFAGVLLAWLPIHIAEPFSPERIYGVLLPPLIFEAAVQIQWSPFRRELPIVLTLVFLGVPLAAACVAAGMHYLLGWSWLGAFMFGFLIAATDPVAVIATFKEQRVEPRLTLLVESESLLNDAAAAVGFAVLVAMANGVPADLPTVTSHAALEIGGGVGVGIGVTCLLLLLAGRTDDHLVEITLTTIAAYASFLVAEQLQASGVLASVTAGLVVGNVGWRGAISSSGRGHVLAFWAYAAFVANSLAVGQARHQCHELKQIHEAKKRATLPNDDFRIRACRIGPLRRNGANGLVLDAQQKSLARSVGSLTDADKPSSTERMKWLCYPHQLRQSRRRGCIPR